MSDIKPLCRKRFLAQTVIDMDGFLRELVARHPFVLEPDRFAFGGPQYMGSAHAHLGVKSLEQKDHLFFANEMWNMAYQLYSLALDRRTDWGRLKTLQGDIWSPGGKPRIGSMVFVHDSIRGENHSKAVGQLIQIEREPQRGWGGRPRLYEDDGGPPRMSEQYVLRLLDGTEFRWYNASLGYMPTARTFQMYREIITDVFGEDQMWGARA